MNLKSKGLYVKFVRERQSLHIDKLIQYHICKILIIPFKTIYDYNLTIMKSPKPATDNRFKWTLCIV